MNNTYWEYSYDYDNKLICITHIKLKINYIFNELYINNGYLCDEFLQSKFEDRLSDLDLIQVSKVLFRHRW